MVKNYKMVGGSNRKIEYGLSLTLIILTVLYLAIFSGLCQKLTAGCVKIDSTLGKMGIAGIGVTIGMIIAIIFTFLKPMLCNWPNGIGTILFIVMIGAILVTGAAIIMSITDEKTTQDKDGNPVNVNPEDKLLSINLNSVLFLSIAIGMIYAVMMNMMSMSVGRKPIVILGSTLIPIAIYTIVVGSIILAKYNKNKNSDGVCTQEQDSSKMNLSGIANILGDRNEPPNGMVLGMIIGASIFLVLIAITLYFTKGKM